jgi:diketogulonate reductase-like aldo/keto reductase
MDDQVIVKIAQDHKVHPAAICLKWAVQRGNAAIPMSANPKNIRANLAAVCSDPLTAAEMSAINQIDRQCRLVKGHVFLWNSAKDWNDLWDIDGFITQ